ncbi:hypothetical protein BB559_002199 [Furculomyces boomerangus]|uniref:Fcf2 pre-rRNA processing C-terminal domain-containing protein n=2 Tax=Harpellales TaxID=61421 RepID=A0A2T9YX68_9FUNG|nr:hypothetical protein BB559_002199 [Furculomyces boomerangus]PVZ99547.1 hypothetical protein BB558_004441 [Smittium angustum]
MSLTEIDIKTLLENARSAVLDSSLKDKETIGKPTIPKFQKYTDIESDKKITTAIKDSVVKIGVSTTSTKLEINESEKAVNEDYYKSLNQKKMEKKITTGPKWFDMKSPVLTEELKRDLHVLKLRNTLDPKRFYKRNTTTTEIPKYFQVGTIIEGPTEFYSSRLTRKQRMPTIVDELLADSQARNYFKRKYKEIQTKNQSGGKNFARKQKLKRSNRK